MNESFLSNVVRLTADALKRSHQSNADSAITDSARAIAADPLMAAHADELKRAATPPKKAKEKKIRRFKVTLNCADCHVAEAMPQPTDATVEVWVEPKEFRAAKLGETTPDDALLGARMFHYFKRAPWSGTFAAVRVIFKDKRVVVLHADSLVPVTNAWTAYQPWSIEVDMVFDDGRGPFTMNFGLSNRSYRRHEAVLSVPPEHSAELRRVGPISDDPSAEGNTIRKQYFDMDRVLTLAERVRSKGLRLEPSLLYRGHQLVPARLLRRGMTIHGQRVIGDKHSFDIKSVESVSVTDGIAIYGDNEFPFYRLDGVPVFALPKSMISRWNEAVAAVL